MKKKKLTHHQTTTYSIINIREEKGVFFSVVFVAVKRKKVLLMEANGNGENSLCKNSGYFHFVRE